MSRGALATLALLLCAGFVHAQDEDTPLRITWRRVADMDLAVGGPAFGVLGGSLVVTGGTAWLDAENKIWSDQTRAWDLRKGAWEPLPTLPVRSGYPCAVVFQESLHVFGGQSSKDLNGRDAWVLSASHGAWAWRRLGDLPEDLANQQPALVGATVFLVAGDSGEGGPKPTNRVWKARLGGDCLNWEACAPLPGIPRTGVATTACDGRVYSFGGGVREAYSYDPKSGQWTRIADPPFPVQWSWAVALRERYIVMPGGFVPKELAEPLPPSLRMDANGFLAEVLVYDTATGKYTLSDPLPKGIIDYGLAETGGRIYLAGGEDLQQHRESWILEGVVSVVRNGR